MNNCLPTQGLRLQSASSALEFLPSNHCTKSILRQRKAGRQLHKILQRRRPAQLILTRTRTLEDARRRRLPYRTHSPTRNSSRNSRAIKHGNQRLLHPHRHLLPPRPPNSAPRRGSAKRSPSRQRDRRSYDRHCEDQERVSVAHLHFPGSPALPFHRVSDADSERGRPFVLRIPTQSQFDLAYAFALNQLRDCQVGSGCRRIRPLTLLQRRGQEAESKQLHVLRYCARAMSRAASC